MEFRSTNQPVKSILDTDLYKLSMQNAIMELFPDTQAEYVFLNRNTDYKFDEPLVKELQEAVDNMALLKLTDAEKNFLKTRCPYLKPSYLEYLLNYKFDPSEVKLSLNKDQLQIAIKGPWCRTVLWEVPLMATISELYFRRANDVWGYSWTMDCVRDWTTTKANILWKNGCRTSEFGTRRRRSYETQLTVVDIMKDCPTFVGTSNVFFAMMFGLKPIGTVAHEWFMGMSVLHGLRHANRFAMDDWDRVYKGNLGTALTDTYGSEAFFKDFSLYHSKLWSDIRQDSGDPFAFVDMAVSHYKSLGIDPMTKGIIFSDSLNVDKCVNLNEYCKNKIRCSFGIGTNLTNDFPDKKALNMVIKLKSIDGVPVVKLSDDPDKAIGDRDAMRVVKWTFLGENLDFDRED